jgi:hypothetical protein
MAAVLPRYDAKVRDKVQGCNQCNLNRIGFIQAITGSGAVKKYFIRWEEGENIDEDGRGCQSYAKRGFVKYVPGENCGLRGSAVARAEHTAAVGGAHFGRGGNARIAVSPVEAGDGEESDRSEDPAGRGSGDASSNASSVGTDGAADDDDEAASVANAATALLDHVVSPNIAAPLMGPARPLRFAEGSTVKKQKKVGGCVKDEITWTCRTALPENLHTTVHTAPPVLKWGLIGKSADEPKCEYDYWSLLYPALQLQKEVELTNANLAELNQRSVDAAAQGHAAASVTHKPTSVGEILRKKGLRLVMALQPMKMPVQDYWKPSCPDGHVLDAHDFGKYGMPKNRFMVLEQAEQFCECSDADDPWWRVRMLISWYERRRVACMVAGQYVTIDESGSWWLGRDAAKLPGFLQEGACPHVTWIRKKPKPTHIEFKNVADVATGIMLCLELQEGATRMAQRPFHRPHGASVAWSLRLLQAAGLLGSYRVLIGDAAFGSVTTAKALLTYGMHCMMIVKQCHTLYPKKEMLDWAREMDAKHIRSNRGRALIYSSSVTVNTAATGERNTHSIAAVGYLFFNCRTTLLTFGSCKPGPECVEARKELIQDPSRPGEFVVAKGQPLRIPCPENIADMIAGFGAIDQHNMLRQGILRLEAQKKTWHWWKRVHSTLEGMHVTDAFKAYLWDLNRVGRGADAQDYVHFVSKLAYQMIHNVHLAARQMRDRPVDIAGQNAHEHPLANVTTIPGRSWKKAREAGGELLFHDPRKKCVVCGKHSTFFCITCSRVDRLPHVIVGCCGTPSACHSVHLAAALQQGAGLDD